MFQLSSEDYCPSPLQIRRLGYLYDVPSPNPIGSTAATNSKALVQVFPSFRASATRLPTSKANLALVLVPAPTTTTSGLAFTGSSISPFFKTYVPNFQNPPLRCFTVPSGKMRTSRAYVLPPMTMEPKYLCSVQSSRLASGKVLVLSQVPLHRR